MTDLNVGKWYFHEYSMTAKQPPDELTVEKNDATEWSSVTMDVNGSESVITLRSKAMAEQLHFMLGQLLGMSS